MKKVVIIITTNINQDLSNLNKDDIYGLMLIMLYASSNNPKYSTLNELAYILDHSSFLNFIKYFEGQTITIPTMQEIKTSLKTLLLYQYSVVDHMEWLDALSKAGFTQEETHGAKRRLCAFKKQLENNEYKLGGIINDYNIHK